MSKTVNILFIIVILVIGFSSVYDTFVLRKRLLRERVDVHWTEEYRGEMKYIIFSNRYGGMVEINYTLDSMEYEANKRGFYK